MPQALLIQQVPLCKYQMVSAHASSIELTKFNMIFVYSEEREDSNQSAEVSSLKMPAPSNSNNSSFTSVLDRQQQQSVQPQQSQPEVDEDGYCIQPKDTLWDTEAAKKGRCKFYTINAVSLHTFTDTFFCSLSADGFYSDSDSDSDGDTRERKIHVEIKPLNNGSAPISASVDELRATVENLSLSPLGGALSV